MCCLFCCTHARSVRAGGGGSIRECSDGGRLLANRGLDERRETFEGGDRWLGLAHFGSSRGSIAGPRCIWCRCRHHREQPDCQSRSPPEDRAMRPGYGSGRRRRCGNAPTRERLAAALQPSAAGERLHRFGLFFSRMPVSTISLGSVRGKQKRQEGILLNSHSILLNFSITSTVSMRCYG